MTTTYRYLKWNGAQNEFKLDTEDFFKEFSNFLMEGWTPDEAFEWIMKQGIRGAKIKVMGIDALRSELAKYKEKKFQSHNLKESLSGIRKELTEIVEKEMDTLKNTLSVISSDYQKRKTFLKNLPDKLSSAIEALSSYDFIDSEAKNRL